MIPILYESTETAFTSNGIGRLAECTSCTVTEVRNGEYECEFSYPITGKYFEEIQAGRYVSCTHDDHGDRQPFKIYSKSAPMNGVVTFNARHRSYDLNHVMINPMTAESVTAAFDAFVRLGIPSNPFTFLTDVETEGTFELKVPSSVRGVLGGVSGSILDVYGGEYEWDNLTVNLHSNRGRNSGITIRYGKNLTDIDQTLDHSDIHNGVVPYWYSDVEDGGVLVTLPEIYVVAEGVSNPVLTTLDLSERWEEAPSVEQLRSAANAYLRNNRPWNPKENIKISFVQLWQTEEYKDVAALQRLSLCDRVNVYYPEMGITVEDVQIIKTVYNVLLDRYDEMELGDAEATLADTVMESVDSELTKMIQRVVNATSLERAIAEATNKITGGAGGVFKWKFNANGEPIELLILDTGNENTAINVWRWNSGGLGHSSNGYDGPYDDFAITMDGKINASAITTGTMLANFIRGGTLTLGGSGENAGEIIMLSSSGNQMGHWSRTGFSTTGMIQQARPYTYNGESRQANVYMTNGRVSFSDLHNHVVTIHGMMSELLPDYSALPVAVEPNCTAAGYPDFDSTKTTWEDLRGLDVVPRDIFCIGAFTPRTDDISKYRYSRLFSIIGGSFSKSGYPEVIIGEKLYTVYVRIINDLRLEKNIIFADTSHIYWTEDKTVYMDLIGQTGNQYVEIVGAGLMVNGRIVASTSSSSRRYKHDIKAIEDKKLDPNRLYDLPVRQFEYNDDATLQYADMEGQALPGFIAEEVAAVYPSAVIRDQEGRIESWDERRILPGVLALVQEQKKKIDSLEARIEKLESLVNSMIGD